MVLKNFSHTQKGKTSADTVWMYYVENSSQTIKEIIEGSHHSEVIDYEMINPTLYKIRVKGDGRSLLAFGESYNPYGPPREW
jgi:hypothetical protein